MKMSVQEFFLAVDGQDIRLEDFHQSVGGFQDLLNALARFHAGAGRVEWILTDLSFGSAKLRVQGRSSEEEVVASIARDVGRIMETLSKGESVVYPHPIPKIAARLTRVLEKKTIQALRIGVDGVEYCLIQPIPEPPEPPHPVARGRIRGFLDVAWAEKPVLRIGLRDPVSGRRIEARFPPADSEEEYVDYQEKVRALWGRYVEIIGDLEYDPETGRLLKVRHILALEPAPAPVEGALERVRGLLEGIPEAAEVLVRRLRDGE